MLVTEVEKLEIYQIAVQLAQEINNLTNKIPFYWNLKDVDQIKRSSSSVPSNISEGFSQRFYPKKYIHYLNIALGSSDETQNHLKLLYKKGYLASSQYDDFSFRCKKLSVKILNLINYERKKHNL